MKTNAYLHFKIIYRDDHLLEIEVSASNGKYCGVTTTYIEANGERLSKLGQMLLNFPENIEHRVMYELGADNEYVKSIKETQKQFPTILAHLSYIGLDFHCIDAVGHAVTEITLHTNTEEDMVEGVDAKVYLKLPFEPESVTKFARELISMGTAKSGDATLQGYLK